MTVDLETPLGTAVRVTMDSGRVFETVTRSRAWVTPAGRLVVMVKGISGAYDCSRVEVIG